MQTKEIFAYNIEMATVLLAAATKRLNGATTAWAEAPRGSQKRRRAFDKMEEAQRGVDLNDAILTTYSLFYPVLTPLPALEQMLVEARKSLASQQRLLQIAVTAHEQTAPGSNFRRKAYDELASVQRAFNRLGHVVGALEWGLSEPVSLRWFEFVSKTPFDQPPAYGVTYCGYMAFYETTHEAQQLLVDAGYQFLASRPDADWADVRRAAPRVETKPAMAPPYPPGATVAEVSARYHYPHINEVEMPGVFSDLVRKLSHVAVHLYRPDYTD